MTLKSDKHKNYDVHNMLQCQILHQSGVLYMTLFLQCTVNRERFTGLNFRGFHSFVEDRESFSVNAIIDYIPDQ